MSDKNRRRSLPKKVSSLTPLSPGSASEREETTSDQSWGLSEKQKRALWRDIERRGGIGVCSVHRLCDEKPHRHGAKNSSLRRQTQNIAGRWKAQTASQFLATRERLFKGFEDEVNTSDEEPAQVSSARHPAPTPKSTKRTRLSSPLFLFHQSLRAALPPANMDDANAPWAGVNFDASKFDCDCKHGPGLIVDPSHT